MSASVRQCVSASVRQCVSDSLTCRSNNETNGRKPTLRPGAMSASMQLLASTSKYFVHPPNHLCTEQTPFVHQAVGYIMEKVDLVLVGAHGVVESGGIINKLGTSTVAIVASTMSKPLYVAVESHKFVRIFPINQVGACVRPSPC